MRMYGHVIPRREFEKALRTILLDKDCPRKHATLGALIMSHTRHFTLLGGGARRPLSGYAKLSSAALGGDGGGACLGRMSGT
jgi:hypothetical protein